MRSIRLFSLWGFPILVHWTFFLLLLGVAVWSIWSGDHILTVLWHLSVVLLIFVCVVLHECGHAFAARRYEVPIRDILILPIGGLARLEYIPTNPIREMVIAVAGPMVNLVLSVLFGAVYLAMVGEPEYITSYSEMMSATGLLFGLALINLTLFVFNLIPAFPMDGGRILRAALSVGMGRYKATLWASYIAQMISIVFVVAGYYMSAYTVFLIGIFIFMTARWERRYLIHARDEEE